MTRIFHPNIAKNGEICVNTLKKDWKPTLGLRHVLLVISIHQEVLLSSLCQFSVQSIYLLFIPVKELVQLAVLCNYMLAWSWII